jgi:NADPH:quinone reductase-like Zn-dependent oxidoreductase
MTKNNSHSGLMQAVFLEKPGDHLLVKEIKIPVPGPNEVLVKIAAAPINPSDIRKLKDAHVTKDISSFIPGIEGSGTVVAAGKGLLPHLWLGKRVACSSGNSTSGTWAEYMVTSADHCFPTSKKVTDEQASMTLVNPLTALAFFDIIIQDKHKAIINTAALSSLGRMIELLGEMHHIPVINIVRNQKQLSLLQDSGSRFILDSSNELFLNHLKDLSSELKATILFDAVCGKQLLDIIEVLPYGSSVIIYGNLSDADHILLNPRKLITNNINISGFYLGNRTKERGFVKNVLNLRKVNYLLKTDLKIKVHNKFPLSMAQEALESYLNNMSAGKVLLIPGLKQKQS